MIGARGNRRRKSILVPSWSQHRQAGKDDKEAGCQDRGDCLRGDAFRVCLCWRPAFHVGVCIDVCDSARARVRVHAPAPQGVGLRGLVLGCNCASDATTTPGAAAAREIF